MKNRIKNSIKYKFMAFAFLLILIVSTTFSLITYYNYYSIMLNKIERDIATLAAEVAKHADQIIYQSFLPLKYASGHDAVRSMNSERINTFFLNQVNPIYGSMYIVNMDGLGRSLSGETIDFSGEEAFNIALKGKINYSDIIIPEDEPAYILAAFPIISDDRVTGVLAGKLMVSKLLDINKELGYGEGGYSFIVNERGTFVSHTDKAFTETYVNIAELVSVNDNYKDFGRFYEEAVKNQQGVGGYEVSEREIIMGYADIPTTGWMLFIGAPEYLALKEITAFSSIFFFINLLFILIAVALSWQFARMFTVPIKELDGALVEVTEGNSGIRIKAFGNDEIGRAAKSFNKLLDTLQSLQYYDKVTKLPNYNVLSSELTRIRKSGRQEIRSLMMIGIGNFSLINETYGFDAGDMVLYEAAERIKSRLSINNDVYNGKGEEIIIIGKERDETSADVLHKAEEILLELIKPYKVCFDREILINVNIGVLFLEGSLGEDALSNVAYAKSLAQISGSNRIEIYDPQSHHETRYLKSIEDDLRFAIEKNEFLLAFQPIYNIEDLSLLDAEALIRWKHPLQGFISPDMFIRIAERTDYIIKIDHWVINEVLKQQRLWNEEFIVSINISAKTFEDENFISFLADKVKRYKLKPDKVQLELTERVVLKHVGESIEKLNTLRMLGFMIALDDFGVGYSSLSYLVKLPIDTVKIDKSFVQNAIRNKESRIITTTIVSMCRDLGLETIAEGVEDIETVSFLKSIKCSSIQGYYYGRPVLADDFQRVSPARRQERLSQPIF